MRLALLCLLLPAPLAFALGPPAAVPAPVSPDQRAFFEKNIRPLLVARCEGCHATRTKKRGGLLLDSRAGLARGGDSGAAVTPGHPDRSLLIRTVRHDHATLKMPPSGKLAPREVALLEEWVRRGAVYPDAAPVANAGRQFWSFQPLRSHQLPDAEAHGWARGRIDCFLLAAMTPRGLAPSPEADRRTLVRRVTFDLVGLPPTPEEVESFVADTRPGAYERLVERLLASPRHGERWGRFWLDLVRYSDVLEEWAEAKAPAFRYRDWVVRALNEDLPYDQFVHRQFAADLMPGLPSGERAALGLLGLSPSYWKELKLDHNVIKTVVAEEWEERIHTVSSTFLGLTAACARCHDHKSDPVTMGDYYALAGVFASAKLADLDLGGGVKVPGVVESSLEVLPDGPQKTRLRYHDGKPTDVPVQLRGNPATPGPPAPRRFLAVLSRGEPAPFRQGSGRLELARAITTDAQALAARVIVNRVWRHHFGEGLVRTPSDFGAQGERPSHPELLDDLAGRFVEAGGWSLRWLHREIVLSAAYRQSSRYESHRAQVDPENRWLARMSRRKLEVEAWRDAVLSAAGTLRGATVGGPAVGLGDEGNDRRTLYGVVKRRELHDLLRLYDFPDPTTHAAGRVPTTTPLQGLFVLNSPFMHAQSAALVRRLHAEAPAAGDAERVRRAYALLYGRAPTAAELRLGLEYLGDGGGDRQAAWRQYAQVLLGGNELTIAE